MQFDAFDIRLLEALQEDNQLSASELADQTRLSPGSCLRRIKRMREEGVIAKDVSILNPEAVGRKLTMVVLVSLERERVDLIEEFKKSMLKTSEVMQCYYVTGDADFVLVVTAVDMSDYEEFTKRFFFENTNVRKFTTLVVMNRVKFGTAIPISM
jgi:Lrp/AsnC family transcriptional regulator, leucine-responsive regulatory protein